MSSLAENSEVVGEIVRSRLRRQLEVSWESKVQKVLMRWYADVADSLLRSRKLLAITQSAFLAKKSGYPKRQLEQLGLARFNELASELMFQPGKAIQLSSYHKRFFISAYDLGAVVGLRMLGKYKAARAFNLSDDGIVAENYVRCIEFYREIERSVFDNIARTVVSLSYIQSKSAEAIAEQLKLDKRLGLSLARQTVRTEIQVGFNRALYDVAVRSGVKAKGWATFGDLKVRKLHVDNAAAGSIDLAYLFPSGQLHPGDGVQAIGCRCGLVYDLTNPDLVIEPWDGSPGAFFTPGLALHVT